jgi:hypothetical protein
MVKDWWGELWNPDNRAWQIIDRFLFILLPLIALCMFLFPNIPQEWKSIMSNLLWLIPLSIWVLFSVTVIPLKMASKYRKENAILKSQIKEIQKPNKNLGIRKKLTDLWCDGLTLQFDHAGVGKPIPTERINNWILETSKYVSEELGKDYLTTLYTIDNAAIPIFTPDSKEHKESVTLIAQRMYRLHQFISELRDKK